MRTERETSNRLELCALTKTYGAKYAIRDVTLTLHPGVTALLGHNGAGKSTLMQILATTARPTSGELRWNGEAIGARTIDRLRARLGYVPQQFAGYPQQTVDEFLTYIARLRGIRGRDVRSRVANSLEAFALLPFARTRLSACSPGTLQRVGIAQALLADPALLLLDEPTAGVDPANRDALRMMLRELGRHAIVLISTHILSDLTDVATRAVTLHAGNVASDERIDVRAGRSCETAGR